VVFGFKGLGPYGVVGLFGFLFVGWFGCSCVMQARPLGEGIKGCMS
jgi:hypothetical protein